MAFSKVGRIAGDEGETNGWKFDGPRLIQPFAYHERQSTASSAEL